MENIFWYIFYGILSTFLVHPWYIKGLLKGKTIFKDYNSYYGFSFKEKVYLYVLTIIGLLMVFFVIKFSYRDGHSIIPPYTPNIVLLYVISSQLIIFIFFIVDTKNFFKGLILIALYFIILSGINYKASPFIRKNIPNIMDCENIDNISAFIPEQSIFSSNDIRAYEEDNLKFLLENGKTSSSITILNNETNSYTKINLNENLNSDAATIRKFFPNVQIKYTGITITKDNKVYKTYVIYDVKAFCYTPTITKFVLKDCNSDNILTIE